MPQLDILTYQTQFFWLFLTFLLFFSLNHLLVLPRFYTLLKVRKRFLIVTFRFTEFYQFLTKVSSNKKNLIFSLVQRNNFSLMTSLHNVSLQFFKFMDAFCLILSRMSKDRFFHKYANMPRSLVYLLCLF